MRSPLRQLGAVGPVIRSSLTAAVARPPRRSSRGSAPASSSTASPTPSTPPTRATRPRATSSVTRVRRCPHPRHEPSCRAPCPPIRARTIRAASTRRSRAHRTAADRGRRGRDRTTHGADDAASTGPRDARPCPTDLPLAFAAARASSSAARKIDAAQRFLWIILWMMWRKVFVLVAHRRASSTSVLVSTDSRPRSVSSARTENRARPSTRAAHPREPPR